MDADCITYHIANILSATLQCMGLTLIVNTNQERLLANVAPIVLGILAVRELVDMGLLTMGMLLLGLLVLLLGLLILLLILLVLILLVGVLPGAHLDDCDLKVVRGEVVKLSVNRLVLRS